MEEVSMSIGLDLWQDSFRVETTSKYDEALKEAYTNLGFDGAIHYLKLGAKVKRANWGGYWYIDNVMVKKDAKETVFEKMILAYTKDNRYVPAAPYQEDLLTDDWEIIIE